MKITLLLIRKLNWFYSSQYFKRALLRKKNIIGEAQALIV